MLDGVLEIDRSVSATVDAPPERCLELLADVEGYPAWSSLISSASVDGDRVWLRVSVLGVGFEMVCSLELSAHGAVLGRLPNDAGDDERFEADWVVTPGAVELHVVAALDAPGPARLIRGRVERRVVDDLLADFVRAL
ncbi:MAG: Polyketide cyclase / dehydrase and lipid transport [Thermoleophilaceae bacterium]|nr:Polyketide cyclase / dehydrase and lipid transport [Thermoleophilaceae bacterium]